MVEMWDDYGAMRGGLNVGNSPEMWKQGAPSRNQYQQGRRHTEGGKGGQYLPARVAVIYSDLQTIHAAVLCALQQQLRVMQGVAGQSDGETLHAHGLARCKHASTMEGGASDGKALREGQQL